MEFTITRRDDFVKYGKVLSLISAHIEFHANNEIESSRVSKCNSNPLSILANHITSISLDAKRDREGKDSSN